MNKLPKISVVTITYGHQDYITETLDGVFMQQYDGPIEFIIANDNSPDNTDEVVKNYLATHDIPENFEVKYTKHEENLGVAKNFIWALKSTTGKYIALCEGDDYWIDSKKLQLQCDFLEANLDYSLIAGNYLLKVESHTLNDKECSLLNEKIEGDCNITLQDFSNGRWLTKTLTLFFRNYIFDYRVLDQYVLTRDVHLNYHLLSLQKGYYMNRALGVYRKHEGGIFSSLEEKNEKFIHYSVYKELYIANKNKHLKNILFNSMISYGEYDKKIGFKSIRLINSFLNVKIYGMFVHNFFWRKSK